MSNYVAMPVGNKMLMVTWYLDDGTITDVFVMNFQTGVEAIWVNSRVPPSLAPYMHYWGGLEALSPRKSPILKRSTDHCRSLANRCDFACKPLFDRFSKRIAIRYRHLDLDTGKPLFLRNQQEHEQNRAGGVSR